MAGATSPMFDTYGSDQLLENETRLYDLKWDPGQDAPPEAPGRVELDAVPA